MPEGPEVKVVTNWLHTYAAGKIITDCCTEYKGKSGYDTVKGSIIEKITCKGKQIFFHFSRNGKVDIIYNNRLALFGKWTSDKPESHLRFWFKLGNTLDHTTEKIKEIDTTSYLYFSDTTNFGGLDILSPISYEFKLQDIGPDLLSENVSFDLYKKKIMSSRIKNQCICKFLTEQKYFSGIGNYLKSEILYFSRIAPNRTLGSLTESEIIELYTKSIQLIKLSYSYGGLTIDTFWSPDGKRGEYPKVIYDMIKDPLGNPIMKSTEYDGKSTYWVPSIQK